MPHIGECLERIEITQIFVSICHMQVCVTDDVTDDVTDEEILDVCNTRNPSGTSMGWTNVIREHENPNIRETACLKYPGRKHLLVGC